MHADTRAGISRRRFGRLAAAGAILAVSGRKAHAQPLEEVRLDFAYYSVPSLALRRFGWLEEHFRADRVKVRWVQSQGSNRALEFLAAGGVDFGSTAGLAALLARANGNPIRTVYVFAQPEWTALAVARTSAISTLADLRSRRIAVTKGTDPHLFLLRALREAGIPREAVEVVHLQHADGRAALEQGRVDAWAGLDPHLAASELLAGTRVIYRNPAFNTFGVLNATDAFLTHHPGPASRVLAVYERARRWVVAHPQEAARLLADEARLPISVAERQLRRTKFPEATPGGELRATLEASAPLLAAEHLVRRGSDPLQAIDGLLDPRPLGIARTSVGG
jgi:sulfonate transport system substrate-binding protein